MEELNQEETYGFEYIRYAFGEKEPHGTVVAEFPYTGDPSDIEYVQKTCGCSSVKVEGSKVIAEVDLSKAAIYNPNTTVGLTKYVYVYFNDGEPRFIANEQKEQIANPKKKMARLMITGNVIVPGDYVAPGNGTSTANIISE